MHRRKKSSSNVPKEKQDLKKIKLATEIEVHKLECCLVLLRPPVVKCTLKVSLVAIVSNKSR